MKTLPAISMTRRNVYSETLKEVTSWAKRMKDAGLLDRPPNGQDSFAFSLQQYIGHLKFQAKK